MAGEAPKPKREILKITGDAAIGQLPEKLRNWPEVVNWEDKLEWDRGTLKFFDENGKDSKWLAPNQPEQGKHTMYYYNDTFSMKGTKIFDDEGNIIETLDKDGNKISGAENKTRESATAATSLENLEIEAVELEEVKAILLDFLDGQKNVDHIDHLKITDAGNNELELDAKLTAKKAIFKTDIVLRAHLVNQEDSIKIDENYHLAATKNEDTVREMFAEKINSIAEEIKKGIEKSRKRKVMMMVIMSGKLIVGFEKPKAKPAGAPTKKIPPPKVESATRAVNTATALKARMKEPPLTPEQITPLIIEKLENDLRKLEADMKATEEELESTSKLNLLRRHNLNKKIDQLRYQWQEKSSELSRQRVDARAVAIRELKETIEQATETLEANKRAREADEVLIADLGRELETAKAREKEEGIERERKEKIEKDKEKNPFKWHLIGNMGDETFRVLFLNNREEVTLEKINIIFGENSDGELDFFSPRFILPGRNDSVYISSNGFSLQLQNLEEVREKDGIAGHSPQAKYKLMYPDGKYRQEDGELGREDGEKLLTTKAKEYQKEQQDAFEQSRKK